MQKKILVVYIVPDKDVVAVLFFRLVVVGSHLDRLLLLLMFPPLALIREKATGEQCFQGLGEGGRERGGSRERIV